MCDRFRSGLKPAIRVHLNQQEIQSDTVMTLRRAIDVALAFEPFVLKAAPGGEVAKHHRRILVLEAELKDVRLNAMQHKPSAPRAPRDAQRDNRPDTALTAQELQVRDRARGRCYKCHQKGHLATECKSGK